jgi:hypothetical protein
MAQVQAKCMFCEKAEVSDEHLWSEWLHPHLPRFPENKRVRAVRISARGRIFPENRQERTGEPWTIISRAVCTSCNNGWMSRIDEVTKPLMLPLVKGEATVCSPEDMSVLTQWIWLKTMICEHLNPGEEVTAIDDRKRFMERREMPSGVRIWVGWCGEGGWECSHVRNTNLLLAAPSWLRPQIMKKNTQTVALGVGQLFVYLMHSTSPAVTDFIEKHLPKKLALIHPHPSGPLTWPPEKRLSVKEANAFAVFLETFTAGPLVQWRGDE